MLHQSNLAQLCIVFLALLVGVPISSSQYSPNQSFGVAAGIVTKSIADLGNNNYQFCSQSDPQDWRDGAGVCFVFTKIGNRIDGYYGYPHSDQFICLRGKVDGNRIAGEALAISWAGHQQNQIPESAFHWDSEKHLTISQGNIIRTAKDGEDTIKWILYRRALLDIDGFYQYNRPRMTTASQLCEWNSLAAG